MVLNSKDGNSIQPGTTEMIGTPRPSCGDHSTWSFVQMNMTLLSIACPRPLGVNHHFREGAVQSNVRPCTPTQEPTNYRLHPHATNMSPRRHDVDCSHGRAGVPASCCMGQGLSPTPKAVSGTKRKFSEPSQVPSFIDTLALPLKGCAALRLCSCSDDLCSPSPRSDSGYCSDPVRKSPLGNSQLHRSSSSSSSPTSSRVAKGSFRGKRVLELQDEDRRFHPEDRGTSSTKRSKH